MLCHSRLICKSPVYTQTHYFMHMRGGVRTFANKTSLRSRVHERRYRGPMGGLLLQKHDDTARNAGVILYIYIYIYILYGSPVIHLENISDPFYVYCTVTVKAVNRESGCLVCCAGVVQSVNWSSGGLFCCTGIVKSVN